MTRGRWITLVLLIGLLVVTALCAKPASTAAETLPRVPKMVWELYLPEEYEGCGLMYGLYARLPEEDRARLHSGTKLPLDAGALTRDQSRALAAWFNSARWGCDPLAEKLDENAVRNSTMVLKCEDSVVEFCLRSPEQGLWKKLSIACAPEKAEWVRDGLPLAPHWYHPVGWEGGLRPPVPVLSPDVIRVQENCCKSLGMDVGPVVERMSRSLRLDWTSARAVYSVYAQLSPDQLRQLHQQHELRLRFRSLPRDQQDSLAEAVDVRRLNDNLGFNMPLDYARPPDARGKYFGMTEVVLEYRRYHPDRSDRELATPGVDPCPRPFRRVFVSMDTPYPPPPDAGLRLTRFVWWVAMPVELQRSLLVWQRESDAWSAKWQYYVGHHSRIKPGAPPRPRHPAD